MNKIQSITLISLFFMSCLLMSSCGEDDSVDLVEGPVLTGKSKTYTLAEVDGSGVSGNVKLEEYDDESTKITISLTGTSDGNTHPAHIHLTSDGSISISLTSVDGASGESVTEVNALDNQTAIKYSELVALNAYVNVHLSSTDLTVVATGGLGGFEESPSLTGQSETYNLDEVEGSGVSGIVKLEEYNDETTKITISLTGTSAGNTHPSHIHLTSDGSISISLTSIDGATGESVTEVAALDNQAAITYSELVALNAYVNVHLSSTDLTVVATGGLGGFDEGGEGATINYDVINSGATAYLFTGNGLSGSSNPNITLKRGSTYTFTVNAPGHPFLINSTQGTGTGNQYNSGVTNNGVASGIITFTVPSDAPATLFYNCEFHGSMTGTITIED